MPGSASAHFLLLNSPDVVSFAAQNLGALLCVRSFIHSTHIASFQERKRSSSNSKDSTRVRTPGSRCAEHVFFCDPQSPLSFCLDSLSNHIKPNQTKPNQTKPNQIRSNRARARRLCFQASFRMDGFLASLRYLSPATCFIETCQGTGGVGSFGAIFSRSARPSVHSKKKMNQQSIACCVDRDQNIISTGCTRQNSSFKSEAQGKKASLRRFARLFFCPCSLSLSVCLSVCLETASHPTPQFDSSALISSQVVELPFEPTPQLFHFVANSTAVYLFPLRSRRKDRVLPLRTTTRTSPQGRKRGGKDPP